MLSIGNNLMVFAIDFFLADLVTTDLIQKITGFSVASSKCKIARTIWHHFNEYSHNQSRDALEG